MSLTRSGYITGETQEIKKELTVRPIVNADFGVAPPPFKVFRKAKSGLCVPRFYAEEKFGKETKDTRPEPSKINVTFKGKLRDETHQNEALRKAIEAGHGILSLPCGFGKTTVSLAIACKLGLRTMIVVHKEFLANQWKERIQQFCPGATIGIVQQNKKEVHCDFVIAMLQSLSLKEYSFEDFDSIGTLIVDEAHHICAKVFSQSLFKLCPKHVYGLISYTKQKGRTHKSFTLVHGSHVLFCRTGEPTPSRRVSFRIYVSTIQRSTTMYQVWQTFFGDYDNGTYRNAR